MPTNNGLITAPVSIADVQTTLGSAENNVGGLCKLESINKWAKYKPVIFNEMFPDIDGLWYRATDGWCGFLAMREDNPVVYYKNNTGWLYVNPTGGLTAPYRLHDFNRYNHLAATFIKSHIAKGYITTVYTGISQTYTLYIELIKATTTTLGISDFFTKGEDVLSNIRFCAHVFTQNPITNSLDNNIGNAFYSDVITDSDINMPITINLGSLTGTRYVLLSISGMANAERFVPIPYDDTNYYLFQIDVSSAGNYDFAISTYAIGYENVTFGTITALDRINNFVNGNIFKVDYRGYYIAQFNVTNKNTIPTVWYLRSGFKVTINGITTPGEIRKINGVAVTDSSFPYYVPASSTVMFEVEFYGEQFGGVNIQTGEIAYTQFSMTNNTGNSYGNIEVKFPIHYLIY